MDKKGYMAMVELEIGMLDRHVCAKVWVWRRVVLATVEQGVQRVRQRVEDRSGKKGDDLMTHGRGFN